MSNRMMRFSRLVVVQAWILGLAAAVQAWCYRHLGVDLQNLINGLLAVFLLVAGFLWKVFRHKDDSWRETVRAVLAPLFGDVVLWSSTAVVVVIGTFVSSLCVVETEAIPKEAHRARQRVPPSSARMRAGRSCSVAGGAKANACSPALRAAATSASGSSPTRFRTK